MIDCFPFTGTIQQPGMDTSYGAATSSKKRKGGILQRMTSAKEELTCESSLLKVLLGMYAKGIRSAPIGVSSDVWCGMLGWDAVTLSRAWQTRKAVTSEKVA